jgi:hypothetical protein
MVHFVEDPRGFRTTYMYNSDRYVMSMAAGTGVWNYTYVHGLTAFNAVTAPSGARTTHNFDTGTGELTSIDWPEGYRSTSRQSSTRWMRQQS